MTKYNPSVRQIPRQQHAVVIPERGDSSILRWLENTGRLIPRETEAVREEADSEEISDLMGSDDASFDDSDDNSDSDEPDGD
ncbi:DUF3134 domain-containing protein [Leptolyngbyaceae cyanobacterium CCMR0082]|uniref:DUF3134 domain-containing protein n=2 Tax=Adonisia turfae TaxID=2950184 RepID=A0A6M0S5P2_9CYAN|nr:DUF3134 domain-containing protein [Adonisia turfae]MDV3353438.1 DUF3134 domain-containing protein [Leptothoe sp. LEGE 181152]NEZ56697.1 DUF3134 domain-containing protein [Adonisia turfae CCMR0081]NEZ63706.1 DUF3134 domain-containing protein [Adonisia turfae CCMR0082]